MEEQSIEKQDMENKEKNLKIGIDIDEIVVEFVKEVLVYLEMKKGKKVKYEDVCNYDLKEPFDMYQEEADKLIKDFFSEYRFDSDFGFVKDAKKSINFLRENNKIFFITSRPVFCKESTLNFFNENFPGNNFEIIFSSEAWDCNLKESRTKQEICTDLNVDLLIEDNSNYALNCANSGVFVILFDKPWNQDLEDKKYKNIYRVSGWNEALGVITKLQGEKSGNRNMKIKIPAAARWEDFLSLQLLPRLPEVGVNSFSRSLNTVEAINNLPEEKTK